MSKQGEDYKPYNQTTTAEAQKDGLLAQLQGPALRDPDPMYCCSPLQAIHDGWGEGCVLPEACAEPRTNIIYRRLTAVIEAHLRMNKT